MLTILCNYLWINVMYDHTKEQNNFQLHCLNIWFYIWIPSYMLMILTINTTTGNNNISEQFRQQLLSSSAGCTGKNVSLLLKRTSVVFKNFGVYFVQITVGVIVMFFMLLRTIQLIHIFLFFISLFSQNVTKAKKEQRGQR